MGKAEDQSSQSNRGSRGSRGSHGSGSVVDDPVELNAIEPMEQKEDKKDHSSEAETEATETQPLKPGDAANKDTEGSRKDLEAAEGAEEGDASQSGRSHKRQWDVKCIVVGLSTLLLIVGGAVIAIVVHKFTGKEPYEFQFGSLYGDQMVLQRAPSSAVVWGHGPISSENATVWVTLQREDDVLQRHTAKLHNRVWQVLLDPVTEHGPFTIVATLQGFYEHTIQLQEVLFGDVWLCAGEDNMQFSVGQLENTEEELAEAGNYDAIRLLSVASRTSTYPLQEQRGTQLFWSKPSAETLSGRSIQNGQFASHFSALCWEHGKLLQGKLHYPIGLISATFSNSSVDEWVAPSVLEGCEAIHLDNRYSQVWNGLIHPVLSLSLYGAIWYQGETDALELSGSFNCTFVGLINHWRWHAYQATGGATDRYFPFGFVQLAPNRDDSMLTYGFTDTRWKQTANYGFVPNSYMNKTFMAVAMDLPDFGSPYGSMHPRDKATIAERLLLGSLAVAYQQKGVTYQGPFPTKYVATPANHTLELTLDTASVDVRNHTGFEVCCSDEQGLFCPSSYIKTAYAPGREWVASPIVASSDSTITLLWEGCRDKHVVAVRYAWRESPCAYKKCGVYDGISGLPMAPYIKIGLVDDGLQHDLPLEQSNFI